MSEKIVVEDSNGRKGRMIFPASWPWSTWPVISKSLKKRN